MEDKIFYAAVFLSIVVHVGLFARIYAQKNELEQLKKAPELTFEIERPVRKQPAPASEISVQQMAPPQSTPLAGGGGAHDTAREIPLFKRTGPDVDSFRMYERQPEKLKGSRVTKEVIIPVLKSEKIDTPTYVSYYQIVRDRIRERAYVNYTKLSVGEVYITFVIHSDGSMGEMQIIEGRSMANDFLREVGQKSVREAGPFPPFPKELDYPELTFNIAISFQYRED